MATLMAIFDDVDVNVQYGYCFSESNQAIAVMKIPAAESVAIAKRLRRQALRCSARPIWGKARIKGKPPSSLLAVLCWRLARVLAPVSWLDCRACAMIHRCLSATKKKGLSHQPRQALLVGKANAGEGVTSGLGAAHRAQCGLWSRNGDCCKQSVKSQVGREARSKTPYACAAMATMPNAPGPLWLPITPPV